MEKPQQLFEVSFEVCNKVGGINTVIKSKARFMDYPNYTLVGPYFENKAAIELDEKPIPPKFKNVFAALKEQGIIAHYGKWNIQGEPETILLDFVNFQGRKNDLKKYYWEKHGIDSLHAHWEFEEPMLFSSAVGILVELFAKEQAETSIVAHFHEWMTGFGLLHLKEYAPRVGTVFTTHATMLGRAMAGAGKDLYREIEYDDFNPEKAAYETGVQDKFTAERACAREVDVFTTVSEITALEAEKILGRKPEVLLYNGLSMNKFPTIEETSIKHVVNRNKLREFIAYYFYPYYSFPMEHTLIYFITARFEYRNKGLDIFVEALRQLNEDLQKNHPERTVVVLFWIPLGTTGLRKEIIENKNTFTHIKNYIDWHASNILEQFTFDIIAQTNKQENPLFTSEFTKDLKQDLQYFKKEGIPSISTHDLQGDNELFNALMGAGLNNSQENRVKVIMYPAYLNGADGLINLSYYEAIVGTHLGVFPSYYEPWGYTPLEAAALAVPAITTDLAGFGRFALQKNQNKKGLFVLSRYNRTWEEETQELFTLLKDYTNLDHVERVENRLAAKTFAGLADWKHFVKYYAKAHEQALQKHQ